MFLGHLDQRLGECLRVRAGSDPRRVVHVLDRVVLCRCVSATLLGQHMDDDWALELSRVQQRFFELLDGMSIERAEVMHTQILEERRRLPHVSNGSLRGMDSSLEVIADPWNVLCDLLHLRLATHVNRVRTNLHQRVGQHRNGRSVRTTVVIQDDRDVALGMAEVVDPLIGHASGQSAITDDRYDVSL